MWQQRPIEFHAPSAGFTQSAATSCSPGEEVIPPTVSSPLSEPRFAEMMSCQSVGARGEVLAPRCSRCCSLLLLRAVHSVKCSAYLGPGTLTCPWHRSWAAHAGKSEVREVLGNTKECILQDEQWSIWANYCKKTAGFFKDWEYRQISSFYSQSRA